MSWMWWCTPVTLTLQRWRQNGQKFKITACYTELRPAWDTLDPLYKREGLAWAMVAHVYSFRHGELSVRWLGAQGYLMNYQGSRTAWATRDHISKHQNRSCLYNLHSSNTIDSSFSEMLKSRGGDKEIGETQQPNAKPDTRLKPTLKNKDAQRTILSQLVSLESGKLMSGESSSAHTYKAEDGKGKRLQVFALQKSWVWSICKYIIGAWKQDPNPNSCFHFMYALYTWSAGILFCVLSAPVF